MWHLDIDKVKARESEYCDLLLKNIQSRISEIEEISKKKKLYKNVFDLKKEDFNNINWDKIANCWNNNKIENILKLEPNNFSNTIDSINKEIWDNDFENWKSVIDKESKDKNLVKKYAPIVKCFSRG